MTEGAVANPMKRGEGWQDIAPRPIDEFIFRWFNDRQPEEMQRCLEAHDALCEQSAPERQP